MFPVDKSSTRLTLAGTPTSLLLASTHLCLDYATSIDLDQCLTHRGLCADIGVYPRLDPADPEKSEAQ